MKTKRMRWVCGLGMSLLAGLCCVQAEGAETVLCSADFESPAYTAGTLTGQQGWWTWLSWGVGYVEDGRAMIGAWNGWGESVNSPSMDVSESEQFKITMDVDPGSGVEIPLNINVYDRNTVDIVNVSFNPASGHILAKGGASSTWIDTGVAYTAGTMARLQVELDNEAQTFSLNLDGVAALSNISTETTNTGFRCINFFGGSNNGQSAAYAYIDNLVVSMLTQVSLPGDANGDGMVDVGDLGILAGNYGMTSGATWELGDFNGDGAVDVGDLGILAGNYGQSAAASVPEPASLGLLGMGILALLRRKR